MSNRSEARARIAELKTALGAKHTEMKNLSDAWKDETGNGHLVLSARQHSDYVKAAGEVKQIQDLIAATQVEAGAFEYLNAADGTPEAGRDAGAGTRTPGRKSLSEELLQSEEWKGVAAKGFLNGTRLELERGIPDLAQASAKDVFTAMGGEQTLPALGRSQDLGFTDRTLRPGRVRDLFPSERTSATTLYGIRETGYTNRARTVAQRTAADGGPATGTATDVFGLKPKSELSIVPVKYDVSTIAHIMYVAKQTLDDEPRMRGIIDRDMVDGVKMAEDEQLLYGDGIGENLIGLMNTEGVQDYAGVARDKRSAQVRRAATRAILAYFQPTGVVLHPFDWEAIELETDNNGAYTVAVSVAVGGEKRVWRLNVADTPAMRQGDALIGAFGTGAKLFDREQVNVVLSTENRDLFERNAYTLRAEERLALVVDRPESFVHLRLTTPTSETTV